MSNSGFGFPKSLKTSLDHHKTFVKLCHKQSGRLKDAHKQTITNIEYPIEPTGLHFWARMLYTRRRVNDIRILPQDLAINHFRTDAKLLSTEELN